MPNYAGIDLPSVGAQGEKLVREILYSLGHTVEPATNYHYDLLCDGEVRIEVKLSHISGKQFAWAFNKRKSFKDHCDIVVLIAEGETERLFFILSSDNQVFYLSDGRPKAGIGIAAHRTRHCPARTGKILMKHCEKWDIIQDLRDARGLKCDWKIS